MSISETRLVAVEEVVLCEKGRDLVEQLSSFKCFNNGKNISLPQLLKGFHPKMKMMSLITHPRVIPNP